jgi:hypothetical protein
MQPVAVVHEKIAARFFVDKGIHFFLHASATGCSTKIAWIKAFLFAAWCNRLQHKGGKHHDTSRQFDDPDRTRS